jgi:hypothetical protein
MNLTRSKRGDTTANLHPVNQRVGDQKNTAQLCEPQSEQTNKQRERERERGWRRRLETRKSEGDSDGIIIDYYS